MNCLRLRGLPGLIFIVVAVVGPTTAATAHDHRPPRTSLQVGGGKQHGQRVHSLWVKRANEKYCDVMDRNGQLTFPPAVRSTATDVGSIVFKKKEMPLEVSLRAWTRVDKDGQPDGEAIPVPHLLLPTEGDAGWQIRFPLPPSSGHLYLLAEANWADEEGCSPDPDLGSQYAAWSFHVRSPGERRALTGPRGYLDNPLVKLL